MAIAARERAGLDLRAHPSNPDTGMATSGRTLRLVPALDVSTHLHPGQADATPHVRPPGRPHMAVRPERRHGSFAAYLVFLAAGAAVGAVVVADFLAAQSGRCAGADAGGQCLMNTVAAPALTRFALVLIVAHALAALVLDVLPDVRAKLRAGLRPRRAPRPAAPAPLVPGEPVSLLAAACWAPVQVPAKVPAGPTRSVPRTRRPDTVRAVCPPCAAIVDAHAGLCLGCGGSVVARRG